MSKIFNIPDIGEGSATVIEILVKEGDSISADQPVIVLESDKASMEVPAPASGKIKKILVSKDQEVSTGTQLIEIEEGVSESTAPKTEAPPSTLSNVKSDISHSTEIQNVLIPDIGTDSATVIEILVNKGDSINKEGTILVLESDKASMELPSPFDGIINSISVKIGDSVSEGSKVGDILVSSTAKNIAPAVTDIMPESPASTTSNRITNTNEPTKQASVTSSSNVHAGPATRYLARELGIDLSKITAPTGRMERITKSDLHEFIRKSMSGSTVGSSSIPSVQLPDFSKFGEIKVEPMTKLHKLTAESMTRSLLNVPPVTQFEDANVNSLEKFRVSLKAIAEKRGTKMTMLPFIVKAVAVALKEFPKVNSSLNMSTQEIIYKQYVNIGFAVDTKKGLVVPVIHNADKKNIWEIANEILTLGKKAAEGKLEIREMQGSCFTISSLGGIGGTYFTPIVNVPEVAILGVGQSRIYPLYNKITDEFEKALILPLSLSYDHRAVNGADGARFIVRIKQILEDIRNLAIEL